nr:hypothetical protein [Tanacetum cinerariifolium]
MPRLLVDRRDGDGSEAGGVKRLWRQQVVSEAGGVVLVGGVVVPAAMVAVHGDGICLLAWMGRGVDIEGHGLGELSTFNEMFSKKLSHVVVSEGGGVVVVGGVVVPAAMVAVHGDGGWWIL